MEPARFLVLIETAADEAEDFEDALHLWFARTPHLKFAIRPVTLSEDGARLWNEDGPAN